MASVGNPDGGVLPWVCLLGVASTHFSRVFWSRASLALAYAPGTFLQAPRVAERSLTAFMKAFKSSLARHAAAHVAPVQNEPQTLGFTDEDGVADGECASQRERSTRAACTGASANGDCARSSVQEFLLLRARHSTR